MDISQKKEREEDWRDNNAKISEEAKQEVIMEK